MLDQLIAASGTSIWGVIFLAIVALGVIFNSFTRKKCTKIAVCQILIIDGDRQGNLIRIENAVTEAKSKGAELICMPQAFILGWLNPEAHNRANPIPGPDSERLCELAKKYKVHLCIGIEEKDGNDLYNSAILIDDQGQILLKHRQINVPQGLMDPPYTPGDDVGVINTKVGRIGLLVCSDTQREDILDSIKTLKPAFVLVPYGYAEQEQNWPAHGREFEQSVKNTATRTSAAVVGANPVGRISNGPWAGRIYGGHSIVADKTGKILASAADRDRDIKLVALDR